MAAITIPAPAVRGSAGRRTPFSPVAGALPDASGPARSRVRLTRRGRRLVRTVVVLAALLVALTALVAGRVPVSQAGDGAARPATATVVVQPGQTLWTVAKSVAPEADVRETIDRIKSLNGLTGAASDTVRPGQQLVVPAAG